MLAIKGYYDGKEFVPLEKVSLKPNQKVIITVLDKYISLEPDNKPFMKYIGKLNNESYNEISEALKETEKMEESEPPVWKKGRFLIGGDICFDPDLDG